MALIKTDGYGGDFCIVTGDDAFDSEFGHMLKITKDELIAAIIGEQVVDKIWARIQRIRTQKHEQMMERINAERGN